jgi:hypothetical protein
VQSQDVESYTYSLGQSTSAFKIWTANPANKVLKTDVIPTEGRDEIKVYTATAINKKRLQKAAF